MNVYIVFYADNGNREDCNVMYCRVVKAKTSKEAIKKACKVMNSEPEYLAAEKVTIIE